MKNIKKTVLIFSAALLAVACSKDAIEEIAPVVGGPVAAKTLTLSVPEMIGTADTRAGEEVATAEEKAIKEVWILQYNASGSLMTLPSGKYNFSVTGNTTVNVELNDEKSTIFVVANKGANYYTAANLPSTKAAFEAQAIASEAMTGPLASGSTTLLPMVGKKEIEAGAESVTVDMKRLVAKVSFKVTNDAPASLNLKLTGVTLEKYAKSVKLAEPTAGASRVYPTAAVANFGDMTETAISLTAKGASKTLVWYVPENLAGVKSTITAPKDKGPQNAIDAFCTRFVVKGTVGTGFNATDALFYIYPGGNATSDFNIKRNYYYSVDATVKNVAVSDTRVAKTEILSVDGLTSNCYMISRAGKYRFRCNVRGNGTMALDGAAIVSNIGSKLIANVSATSVATILWNKSGDSSAATGKIIETAKVVGPYDADNDGIDEYYIEFETPATFTKGNALIAVKATASGDPLWSWHIWATDYNPDLYADVYKTDFTGAKYSSVEVMRCNLGAVGTGLDGLTGEGTSAVQGLFYQWGRKDPFLHENAGNDAGPTTMAIAVAHPTTFYTHNAAPYDWYSGQNNKLWGNPNDTATTNPEFGIKTCFDPCPLGWKVAPQGLWTGSNKTWAYTAQAGSVSAFLTGTGAGLPRTVKYVAAGYLHLATGVATNVGTAGGYWCSSPHSSTSTHAGHLGFGTSGVSPLHYPNRAGGLSVRCVRE